MRSIFITGGASGIGLAAARRFAREGWTVGIGDIDEIGMRRAGEELNLFTYPLDVRDRGQWRNALQEFVGTTGRLDILLNNAGIARYGMFEDVTPDESDLQIDINVKGVVNGAYAALPHLKATPGSRLVNVASVAGIVGSPGLAVYSATKHAVRGLTEALDAEWTRHGVDVTCVMPFYVETPILDAGSKGSNQTIRDAIGIRLSRTPFRKDRIAAALRAAEIEVVTKAEWDATPEIGRFARIHDPEGNPIELWEPPVG